MAVRVLAVDDSAAFRDVLTELVEAAPGFELVGEAASGEEAVELAADTRPDLVLMDVRLPGIDGVEAAARIRRLGRRPVILLLTAETPPQAGDAGGDAVVDKRDLRPALLEQVAAEAALFTHPSPEEA